VDVGVDAAHRLPVRLDEGGRVELGVHHHGVQCGVSEKGGDDVDRGVVVEVFGGEGAAAVVWFQYQRVPVGPARLSGGGQLPQTASDRVDADHARVSGSLE
jgi:hypothetical protein